MATIDVDFDVFKALTAMRSSESVSYNDVLRDVLRLGKPKQPLPPTPVNGSAVAGDWVTKGVRFPAGTEFRANHKGHTHLAKVENNEAEQVAAAHRELGEVAARLLHFGPLGVVVSSCPAVELQRMATNYPASLKSVRSGSAPPPD